MKHVILEYIANEIANEPVEDLNKNEDLLSSGLIDSLGMIKLVEFIEDEFLIKIPAADMIVENFMTVQHIESYLLKRKNVL